MRYVDKRYFDECREQYDNEELNTKLNGLISNFYKVIEVPADYMGYESYITIEEEIKPKKERRKVVKRNINSTMDPRKI